MAMTDTKAQAETAPTIAVVGSINLDLVARAPRLPLPGETVTDASLHRYPGGKGANQALAARRLGAQVVMHGGIGQDGEAKEALSLLRGAGIDLSGLKVFGDRPTGIALIMVAETGENQIVVAPGANRAFTAEALALKPADAVICQMEIPGETVERASQTCGDAFFCLNLAPVRPLRPTVIDRADLIVVNEAEAPSVKDTLKSFKGLLAITKGSEGAVITRKGQIVAQSTAPQVRAVDTTGSGDVFTAALTLSLIRGHALDDALAFACAAGACAARQPGAQPSFPEAAAVAELLESVA